MPCGTGCWRRCASSPVEQLEAEGERDALRDRHREWCLGLARRASDAFWSPQLPAVLDELERERANIGAALDWTVESESGIEQGLLIAGLLWLFWDVHGHLREGAERVERLLTLPGAEAPTRGRAQALDAAAWLSALQGGFERADACYIEAGELWERLDDRRALGWSLILRGVLAHNTGDSELADRLCHDGLERARETGDQMLEGWALFGCGHVAWQRGQIAEAETLLHDSLAIAQHVQVPWGTAWAQFSLGVFAFIQGRTDEALSRVQVSLWLRRDQGDRRSMTDSLWVIGCLAGAQGQFERAVQLLGAAAVMSDATGAVLLPWLAPLHEQSVEAARAALGGARFEELWADGRAMPADEAVALALNSPDAAPVEAQAPA